MTFFLVDTEEDPMIYFGGGGPDSVQFIVGANGILHPSATFTRASTGTTELTQGVYSVAAVNEPRYQWASGRRGLLIEPSATNLVFPSAVAQTMSVAVTAQPYTLSFFGAGSVTLSGTSTGVVVGTGTTLKTFTFTPAAGSLTLTVSGSVTQWQLETGVVATSRIITTSAAATRAPDVPSIATAAFGFNASEGTFICEYFSGTNITNNVVKAQPSGDEFITRRLSGSHGTWNGIQETNTLNAISGAAKITSGTTYWSGGIGVAMNGAGYNQGNSPYNLASVSSISMGPLPGTAVIFNLPYYPRKFTAAELQAASA